jgi:ribonucleotide monophosphatase NagD (HAD superfamily)
MERKTKIAVDLDGTISEYREFFKLFTKAMSQAGCRIYILTDRPPGTEEQVAEQLQSYGITYDTIKITSEKSRYISEEGITVLFDDMDQYFVDLPAEVAVFKIRQKYNFDFAEKRWI